MRKSEYLYGSEYDPIAIAKMPYAEALKHKAQLAHNLAKRLNAMPLLNDQCLVSYNRDTHRVNKCLSAVRHNEALLTELRGVEV